MLAWLKSVGTFFLIFRLIFSHLCSHVIETLQKRVVNNA